MLGRCDQCGAPAVYVHQPLRDLPPERASDGQLWKRSEPTGEVFRYCAEHLPSDLRMKRDALLAVQR